MAHDTYYHDADLKRFPEVGENRPELAEKFFAWYNAVFEDGALSAREKSLIALAVAHAVQCPYCIDAYSTDALEKGADLDQMTEAVHVASAIRGGASLVHGVQMRNHAGTAGDVTDPCPWPPPSPRWPPGACRSPRPRAQLDALNRLPLARGFSEALAADGLHPLRPTAISIFQINVGKLCNQTCRHCHVDAGPDRREVMTRETMAQCLAALRQTAIPTVDITGGAPELNPDFRWLVEQCTALGRHVIDRCNLTILDLPAYADLPGFFAEHRVEVVCSLPHYRQLNTDAQRGDGVFEKSIAGLRKLNASRLRAARLRPARRAGDQPGGRLPPRWAGVAGARVEARARPALRHPVRCAPHDHEHADQPLPRMADRLVEPRGLHGAAGHRLQPRRGARGDVPQHAVGRLGRHALRLRLQPDARPAREGPCPAPHRRLRPRRPRGARHRHRPALLRLHGRGRIELRRGDGGRLRRRVTVAATKP